MVALAGVGGFLTRDPVTNRMWVAGASNFTFRIEPTTEDVLSYPDCDTGFLSPATTITTQTDYFVDLESGKVTDIHLEEIADQRGQDLASATVLRIACGTVPAGGGAVDSNAVPALTGITAASEVTVNFMPADGEQVQGEIVTVAPSAINQVQVGGGQLTFNATGNDNQAFVCAFTETTALTGVIGGPAPLSQIGSREFFGKVVRLGSNGIWSFWARNVRPEGNKSFSSTAETVTYTYKLNSYAGWNLPYFMYK